MVGAARCSRSRASYPGDGVTVGGTARAGAIKAAEPPDSATAATTTAKQNRFISSLPLPPRRMSRRALGKIAPDRRDFKAGRENLRFNS
jgi:hypothetical protein